MFFKSMFSYPLLLVCYCVFQIFLNYKSISQNQHRVFKKVCVFKIDAYFKLKKIVVKDPTPLNKIDAHIHVNLIHV